MSVSVAVLREVAADVESDSAMAASLLRVIAVGRESAVVDGHPNAKLALVIADALNDGQRRHDLLSEHEDHALLLEVAGAARAQVDAERRESSPRKWDRVQDIPDGVRFTEQDDIDDSWIKIGDKYQFTDIYGYRSERLCTSSEFNGYGPFREVTE